MIEEAPLEEEVAFEQQAPVPYVADLTLDGILKIVWDQKMQ